MCAALFAALQLKGSRIFLSFLIFCSITVCAVYTFLVRRAITFEMCAALFAALQLKGLRIFLSFLIFCSITALQLHIFVSFSTFCSAAAEVQKRRFPKQTLGTFFFGNLSCFFPNPSGSDWFQESVYGADSR